MSKTLPLFASLALVSALTVGGALVPSTARADIFVTNWNTGVVGEYTNAGVPINATLITGLNNPSALAVIGNDLFVTSFSDNKIGKYTLSSPGVVGSSSPNLITGLNHPRGLGVAGSSFYVTTYNTGADGAVTQYSSSGAVLSTPISGLTSGPNGVQVYGTNLILSNNNANSLSEYTLAGAPVNTSLVTGLSGSPYAMTILGSDIYVAYTSGGNSGMGKYTLGSPDGTISASNPLLFSLTNQPSAPANDGTNLYVLTFPANRIGLYGPTGNTINANLITGLGGPVGIAVTPEPASLCMLGLGGAVLLCRRSRKTSR